MLIAVITGASSGIGEAFLRRTVTDKSYDQIWVIARREDRLNALKDELDPQRIIPVAADIASSVGIDILRNKLEYEKPSIALLINCAGMGKRGNVKDSRTSDLAATIDLNCRCLTEVTSICIPYMIDVHSNIINIASSAAFLPQPGFAVYAASKAYVVSLSRALACELKPYDIGVTTVCPGPVKTEFLSKATDNKESEFTGLRALCAADADKLAKASLKAASAGRRLFVYGISQKALHLASKIVPTSFILFLEKFAVKQ